MAEVWKAKVHGAHDFERVVVLKRILPHLCSDPRFLEMFIAEARLSARLNHPNIVQVFDFGELDGEYFLAMEFIEGLTLSAALGRLQPGRTIPIGFAIQVVRDIALALGYAHALTGSDGTPLHIIHRDVSPSNVMLGLDGSVKLLDFGVAKAVSLSNEQTRSGVLKGKISYMPPEVVDGHARADARSDLFAASVILHELLTGRRLFGGTDDFETLARIRECVVEAPSKARSDVPPALDQIALRAVSRRPEERFQTGAELSAALAPFMHDLRWDTLQMAEFVRELAHSPSLAFDEPTGVLASERRPTASTAAETKPTRKAGSAQASIAVLAAVAVAAAAAGAAGAWLLATRASTMRSGLIVASDPAGATVEIDRRVLPETTPTAILNLPPGEHDVRLRRTGHSDVERQVRVKAGERAMVQITLPRASHRISITSAPAAATVFLDGALVLGTTPTFVTVTDDDFHDLRVEHPDYETLTYAIKPEERQQELSFSLEQEKEARGTLSVESDGSAQVWLDGAYTGYDTPTLGFRVAVGEHTIELRDSSHVLSAPTRVTIRKGETVHLKLAKGHDNP
jgi:serine/threonine-protein kinase